MRNIKLLAVLILLSALSAHAQTYSFGAINASGQITSSLATGTAPFSVASTTLVANLHAATADSATTSTGVLFSGISGATNTTAAMVIGTGASLTVSGSGTINATTLGGATFAAPGAIGSGTPSTGAFTTLNGMTITSSSGTFTLTNSKTFAVSNTMTLAGTDGSTYTFPAASATIPRVVFSGTKALATGAIASTACNIDTLAATGTLTTDNIIPNFNANVDAVTGYTPATTGGLRITVYPTADTINISVCNPTISSITPGAVTLNLRVIR